MVLWCCLQTSSMRLSWRKRWGKRYFMDIWGQLGCITIFMTMARNPTGWASMRMLTWCVWGPLPLKSSVQGCHKSTESFTGAIKTSGRWWLFCSRRLGICISYKRIAWGTWCDQKKTSFCKWLSWYCFTCSPKIKVELRRDSELDTSSDRSLRTFFPKLLFQSMWSAVSKVRP